MFTHLAEKSELEFYQLKLMFRQLMFTFSGFDQLIRGLVCSSKLS